jgi:hypothetical protein
LHRPGYLSPASTDGRACIRRDKSLDGIDSLPDENAQEREHRMALHVLAYNMKRVMLILGVGGLMEAIRA